MSGIDEMMRTIDGLIGQPYVWGGLDCSGFVQRVMAAGGVQLPRVSNDQARSGQAITQDQAQPGDLVWWDLNGRNEGADHIGIYLGNGKVAEASSGRGEVVIRNLWGNARFTRPTGAPAGSPTVAAGGAPAVVAQQQRKLTAKDATTYDPGATVGSGGAQQQVNGMDAFDLESLYARADESDPGENDSTVGAYAVAQMMVKRSTKLLAMGGVRA